jgi:hypothetical protein
MLGFVGGERMLALAHLFSFEFVPLAAESD